MFQWLWKWLGRKAKPVAVSIEAETIFPEAAEPPPATKAPPKPNTPTLQHGEFHFRTGVLDQLDSYFGVLKRLKKSDGEAYRYFATIGAHIRPAPAALSDRGAGWNQLENGMMIKTATGWFGETLPTRGAVFYVGKHILDEEKELATRQDNWVMPRAAYFEKYASHGAPITVQPINQGTVYRATFVWDIPADDNRPESQRSQQALIQFPVAIVGRKIIVLKQLNDHGQVVQGRHGKFRVPYRSWGYPEFCNKWAKEYGTTPEFHLALLFSKIITEYEHNAMTMTRIAVSKGGMTGVIAVSPTRTAYFFADRDVTVGLNGTKRKVFHIVRAHERISAGGHKHYVRTHFRGERDFKWNGYDISITVPGWDHKNTAECDIGCYDEESIGAKNLDEKTVGAEALARSFRNVIRQRRSGEHERRRRAH